MGEFSRNDFISNLPQGIIQIVLEKIPIRDAVRTSILSKHWRYQWATITRLVFCPECVSFMSEVDGGAKKFGDFIGRFLFLHEGPIHKFEIYSSYTLAYADLAQWLLFLSRKDIQELVLNEYVFWEDNRLLRTPSCIFSCEKLTKLKLSKFEVKPPLGFKGFPCLRYLSLCSSTVSLEVVENLISNCPLLEKLKLIDNSDDALSFRAPNLKKLTVRGSKDVYLEHTPLLNYMVIYFSQGWEGNVLLKVPVTYGCLKVIFLKEIDFLAMNQMLYVLQLLLQSPNMQRLDITDRDVRCVHHKAVDLDFWERECPTNFTFKHLTSVAIQVSNKKCMEFLKFVLGRSPALKLLFVSFNEDCNEEMNMANELLHFPRASPKVATEFFFEPSFEAIDPDLQLLENEEVELSDVVL